MRSNKPIRISPRDFQKAVRLAYRKGQRAAEAKFDTILERFKAIKELNGHGDLFAETYYKRRGEPTEPAPRPQTASGGGKPPEQVAQEVWQLAPDPSHVESFRFLEEPTPAIEVTFKKGGEYRYDFPESQRDTARVVWEEMSAVDHPGIVIWEWLIRGGVPYKRLKSFLKAFDESKHPRNHGQFASSPGNSAVSQETESRPAASDNHARTLAARIGSVPAAIRDKVTSFVRDKYGSLVSKFGTRGAKAILAASVLMLPVPLPGATLIPVAIAHAVMALKNLVVGGAAPALAKAMGGELSDEEIQREARALIESIYADAGEEPPGPADDDTDEHTPLDGGDEDADTPTVVPDDSATHPDGDAVALALLEHAIPAMELGEDPEPGLRAILGAMDGGVIRKAVPSWAKPLMDEIGKKSDGELDGIMVMVNLNTKQVHIDVMDWGDPKHAESIISEAQKIAGKDNVEVVNEGGKPHGPGWVSVYTGNGCPILRKAWDESKHPRGQPGNAGEFGPGGGKGGEGKSTSGAKPTFKVKPPKKLYRGVLNTGQGAGTYSLGKGLYSTPTKAFLRGFSYDKIIELTPEEAFPRNPLVLRNASEFTDWLLRESGMKNIREFNAKYNDPGEFVRGKGYDGVWAGDEVVRYFDSDDSRIHKAFDESLHPRDDHGRFVSKEAIHEAKSDPTKAAELRARVTNPAQRAKLDAALSEERKPEDEVRRQLGYDDSEPAPAKPTDKAALRARGVELARKINVAVKEQKAGTIRAQDVRDLAESIPHMSIQELRSARDALRYDLAHGRGDQTKKELVPKLVEFARQAAANIEAKEKPDVTPGTPPEAKPEPLVMPSAAQETKPAPAGPEGIDPRYAEYATSDRRLPSLMTLEQYRAKERAGKFNKRYGITDAGSRKYHKEAVQHAINHRQKVPAEVLKEYPDLEATAKTFGLII